MSWPTTAAGRDAVRLRGLFGGETEARAGDWVQKIEAAAAAAERAAIRTALEALPWAGHYEEIGIEPPLLDGVRGDVLAILDAREAAR